MLEEQHAKPSLLRRFLPTLLVLLAAAGGVLAWQILLTDLQVYDGGIVSGWLCGSGRWDCNAVAVHDSAWLAGLPLSLWGLLFYIVVLWLALGAAFLRGEDRKAMAVAAAALSLAAVAFDAYLGFVMVAQIGSLCGRCLATYAINLLLALGFIALARSMPERFSWPRLVPFPSLSGASTEDAPDRRSHTWLRLAGTVVLIVALGVTFMFGHSRVADSRDYSNEQLAEFFERLKGPREIDVARFAGQPSIGPADADVTVVLVGDFQCTFCRSLAASMHELRSRHPDRIRMLFVNAPIDSDCNPSVPSKVHPRACWLAQAAACARREGKFWDFHDLVFLRIPYPKVGKNEVLDHMREIGLDGEALRECAETKEAKIEVAKDLVLVNRLDLTTPSFIVNGIITRGGAPRWMVERMVGAALGDTSRSVRADAEGLADPGRRVRASSELVR